MPSKKTNPARAATRPKGEFGSTIAVADIVAWLYERIRSGRLAPGQRLVEADIIREPNTGIAREPNTREE